MGAKGSKTKPNDQQSRRGTLRTLIVTVDPINECMDEIQSPETRDRAVRGDSEDASHAESSSVKVSKVQAILEGKVEFKKQQQLEHLPRPMTNTPVVELDFSSSEDSDENGGKKKRKGSKKKAKKRNYSVDKSKLAAAPAATTPPPVKLRLNELKVPRKSVLQTVQSAQTSKEHFEQIKDAYALAEYTAKESDDPPSPQHAAPPPQAQQASPSKVKQQPSPGSSPGKFFSAAFDNWKKPNLSSNSNRSLVRENRDASRRSPPKSVSNHSAPSSKQSASSLDYDKVGSRRQAPKEDPNFSKSEFDALDHDKVSSFAHLASAATLSNQSIRMKIAEERHPLVAADPIKRPRSDRRNLRIDDTDESIMDDILAEVMT